MINPIKVAIGLGSNLGDPYQYLLNAQQQIMQLASCQQFSFSSIYKTLPLGNNTVSTDYYLNAVTTFMTYLSPQQLLKALLNIELENARQRSYRNAPRTLDLDILLYDDMVFTSEELTIPHPRLQDRFFVLTPLSEIWPEAIHPVLKSNIRCLENDLKQNLTKDLFITKTEKKFLPIYKS